MLKESKVLISNFDKFFLRKYRWRYNLLIVDNHLFDTYNFFLQGHRDNERVLHSYDLLEIKHDQELYKEVLADLKNHTHLRIEYRDTHHLVHPGADIQTDPTHGHSRNTSYHSGKK